MSDFYVGTLRRLLDMGCLERTTKILVVCGADYDRSAFRECGFENVTISNLAEQEPSAESDDYGWSHQDAEELSYSDEAFEFCVAHSGLHHCRMPHRALAEMYRVARRGVLVFEPLDSLTARICTRLGLGQDYEVAAVAEADCRGGGVRNTPIPNYVYRWKPREIEKTINTLAPIGKHTFLYFYAMRLNWQRAERMRSKALAWTFRALAPLAAFFGWVFPSECNNFAFVVLKPSVPEDLHPWLDWSDGQAALKKGWIERSYSGG